MVGVGSRSMVLCQCLEKGRVREIMGVCLQRAMNHSLEIDLEGEPDNLSARLESQHRTSE